MFEHHPPPEADLVIIGSGLSAALVYFYARKAGLKPLILEAKPYPSTSSNHENSLAQFDNQSKIEALLQRKQFSYEHISIPFAGGKSLLWGAWCELASALTLQDAKAWKAAWPLSFAELETRSHKVLRWLGAKKQPLPQYFSKATTELGLPVTHKIFAAQGQSSISSLKWLKPQHIFCGCEVTQIQWEKNQAHRLEYFHHATGQKMSLKARQVVLSAGTLSSTKLLLQSNIAEFNPHAAEIGRNLTNHMVSSYILIASHDAWRKVTNKTRMNALVPRFINSNKRWQRAYRGGFCTELVGPYHAAQLPPAARKILKLEKTYTKQTCSLIHVVGDVAPDTSRFISLRPDGNFQLHWKWNQDDKLRARDMRATAEALAASLNVAESELYEIADPLKQMLASHEASTCRSGSKNAATPCDAFGKLRGVPNAWVADSSIMPTATDCHPTVSLLALVSKVAESVCGANSLFFR